jgi:hypothetical protein
MSFYKTNDPAVLAAHRAVQDATAALRQQAKAFGERFGGEGLIGYSASGHRFAGIRFVLQKPLDIWTAWDKDGMQRPRAKAKPGTTQERRDTLKALRAEWDANAPTDRVSMDPLFQSVGIDWGNVMFSGASWFRFGDWMYFDTRLKLTAQEILGSEFEAAHAASRAAA